MLLRDGDQTICFAGDTSYTQDLMLAQTVDGVATPLIYLPSHDPQSAHRLEARIPVPTLAMHLDTQIGE